MLEKSIHIYDKHIMVKPRTTERERERKKRARMTRKECENHLSLTSSS
jgi:hypothetical protein